LRSERSIHLHAFLVATGCSYIAGHSNGGRGSIRIRGGPLHLL
jgi:hypothetical protein